MFYVNFDFMICIIWNLLVIIVNYIFYDKCLIILFYIILCYVYVSILGFMLKKKFILYI